jgi:hypothetical protein
MSKGQRSGKKCVWKGNMFTAILINKTYQNNCFDRFYSIDRDMNSLILSLPQIDSFP